MLRSRCLPTSLRRVQELVRAADAAPTDSDKQFLLLRELNRISADGPRKLIQRVESSRAGRLDDSGWKEYLKALVSTGRIDDPSFVLSEKLKQIIRTPEDSKNSSLVSSRPSSESWGRASLTALPVSILKFLSATIILVAGWSIVMESVSMGGQRMGGGKVFEPVETGDASVTLDAVKGCEEVKDEIKEIIMYLKDPSRFTRLGAKLPRGVLLSGPPGTGKTLIARAIAGEASVPFFQASGSDFEEMFVGVGAKRIRDLFAAARKSAPCIVFIDEVDALGSKRNARDQSSVRMTLNQLLVELDGFAPNEGVVVICATNLAESLDKALTRPGRLDKLVAVPLPDLQGRKDILKLYGDKVKLADSVDLEILARRSSGMSGADLFNVINLAAVTASVQGLAAVPMSALEDAFDRVVVGLERRNPMSDQEKRMTAVHEGGHALVSLLTKGADPVHKATIMPRGNALGITWQLPEGPERFSTKLVELKARLAVLMGGKAAEDLEFGPDNVTAGCVSDLQQASAIARQMVMQFGMGGGSGILNPVFFNENEYAYLSDSAKTQVDSQVAALVAEAYAAAKSVLTNNSKQLKNLADGLVEFETLARDEINLAVAGKFKDIKNAREKENSKRDSERNKLTAASKPPTS